VSSCALSGMTSGSATAVTNVSYNVANQLLTMYYGYNETRAYNTLGQLTGLNVQGPYGTVESLTYNYPTGSNNGKISSMYNAVSAERVTYTYDSLNRLATATGSGWSQTYGYDPFGNLTSKTPGLSITVNQANNQIQGVYGVSYDANGNQNDGAYDVENRPINDGIQQYAYDAQNRRIWSWPDMGGRDTLGNATGYTVNMYSASGQKLGAYVFQPTTWEHGGFYTPVIQVTLSSSDAYFGSRRLAVMDQLGSAGTYYPWGEAKGSTNPQNTWSFATYWRDSSTGLDYARNRYYSNAYGRFMTPDPFYGSANVRSPQSWNRYAYVWDDPVNSHDPSGLCDTVVGGITESSGDDTGEGQFASGIGGAMLAYPYAGTDRGTGVADIVNTTYNQSVEANTVAVAIEAAAADSSGPINIFAFSGGAAATTEAFSMLPASAISRIASITYISPGTAGVLGTANGITPTVIFGGGSEDSAATMIASLLMPTGWNIIQTNCAHNFGCEIAAAGAAVQHGNPCNQPITFSAQHLTTVQELENYWYQVAYGMVWGGLAGPTEAPYNFEPISFFGLVSNPQSAVTSTITYNMGDQ